MILAKSLKVPLTKFYYVKTFFQHFFHSSFSSSSGVGIRLKSGVGLQYGG